MNDTATRDPNISTRSMGDVRRHRNKRVADTLRQLADRLERDDVQTCRADISHPSVELQQRPGDEWVRRVRQFGGVDDITVSVQATLIAPEGTECPENHAGNCGRPQCPYCAWRPTDDTDPED